MRAHPWLVGGTGRLDTVLMAEVPGVLAKGGAEGVLVAALPDGTAFAAKVDDGHARALGPVLLDVLAAAGCPCPTTLARWLHRPSSGAVVRSGESGRPGAARDTPTRPSDVTKRVEGSRRTGDRHMGA